MAPSYYAVAKGRKPGIYTTWDKCKEQVQQYSGSAFKKFPSLIEAEKFIKENSDKSSSSTNTITVVKKRPALKRKECLEVSEKQSSPKKCKLIPLPIKQTASDYIMDDDGYVEVYTDGACSSNGKRNAQAGVGIWFADNHPMNVSQPVVGRATNNMAEIQAVTIAAKQAKQAGITKLKIHTDSKFMINCVTKWMSKWKVNGWKTGNNKPVINKIELIELEEALKSINVIWKHVYGHQGIHGNEMADKLAREGASQY